MIRLFRKVSIIVLLALVLLVPSKSYAVDFMGLADISAAFLTNLAVHETGHAVVATELGAESVSVSFFGTEKNNLFLGYTDVKNIDSENILPMQIGGEVAANMSFEYSLYSYRKNPTTYKKALMFFSGTDFLFYTLYAFYGSGGNAASDPIIIREETGFKQPVIVGVALAQTLANLYRYNTGTNAIIPVLSYSGDFVSFSLDFPL